MRKSCSTLDELATDVDKAGGLAFPFLLPLGETTHSWPGMTLRDYFAAKAMQGHIARYGQNSGVDETVFIAYKYADAMLEARKI